MKLVEQELWQREEKGLIGILPVRDAAESTSVGSMLSQGAFNIITSFSLDKVRQLMEFLRRKLFFY